MKRLICLTAVLAAYLTLLVSCEGTETGNISYIAFEDTEFQGFIADSFGLDASAMTLEDLYDVESINVYYYYEDLRDTFGNPDYSQYKEVCTVTVAEKGYDAAFKKYYGTPEEERDGLTDPQTLVYTTKELMFNAYSDLKYFKCLKELNFSCDAGLKNVNALLYASAVPGLERLSLFNFNVPSLDPVSRLTELRSFGLYINNRLTDGFKAEDYINSLEPLKACTKLESLSVGGTVVNDISPVLSLKKLKDLSVSNSSLSSVKGIETLTGLETVDFMYNAIEDVTPIAKLPHVRSVYLDYNYITDISPFADMASDSLEYISIDMNGIQDYTPIKAIKDKVYAGFELYFDDEEPTE